MRILTFFFAIVPLLALPLPAYATVNSCPWTNAPHLGIIEVSPTNDRGATVYVDDENYLLGNGIWTYQESNGVFHDPTYGDLQRGGTSPYIPDDNALCTDASPNGPDALIF